MKIEVTEIARTFGRQTRAYAEYRIFSSLAQFSDVVREAEVSLTPTASGHSVACSVLVSFEKDMPVRVTARGRHAYDAINRVAHRLGHKLRRHTHVAFPS
jgi:ribosome-associated translation inhibitor RaiA